MSLFAMAHLGFRPLWSLLAGTATSAFGPRWALAILALISSGALVGVVRSRAATGAPPNRTEAINPGAVTRPACPSSATSRNDVAGTPFFGCHEGLRPQQRTDLCGRQQLLLDDEIGDGPSGFERQFGDPGIARPRAASRAIRSMLSPLGTRDDMLRIALGGDFERTWVVAPEP